MAALLLLGQPIDQVAEQLASFWFANILQLLQAAIDVEEMKFPQYPEQVIFQQRGRCRHGVHAAHEGIVSQSGKCLQRNACPVAFGIRIGRRGSRHQGSKQWGSRQLRQPQVKQGMKIALAP
ncbi:MAG: hypothetical protein DRI34_01375 [Deltaproteobacteria bacterium]|nr:MAG: hypothetical protein DRI34_01375 [Deltaproteobacteria bacterium]